MAETQHTAEQSATGPESSSEPFSARNYFLDKLQGEHQGESTDVEQPLVEENGGSPETEDPEPQSEYQGEAGESTESEEPAEGEEEQPEISAEATVLTVDGEEFTPEKIRELREARLEYDRDYRRKTQYLSRQNQEMEAVNQDFRGQEDVFTQLSTAHLKQLHDVDTSNFTPEEFQQYKNAVQRARQSHAQLTQIFEANRGKRKEHMDKVRSEQAKVAVDMLQSSEPRWSKDFYADIGEFAVQENIMTSEEFQDEADWLRILGIAFMYDKANVGKVIAGDGISDPPPPPKSKKNAPRRRNSTTGKFQSAKQAVMNSPNAKADGSFRDMLAANLDRERGNR
jgi:hypothetical protein